MAIPVISYIIPMYNAECYIAACIDSIMAQDLDESEYEIVIVDDGSTDGGGTVIARYERDSIRYFKQDNRGQSSARNKGVELARGEYVYFVDADDVLVPHSIRFVLETAKHNDLDMVSFNIVRINNEKQIETNKVTPIISDIGISDRITGGEYLEKYNFNNGPWWYIVKKKVLISEGISFVPNRYGEDGMFTMNLLMHIASIVHIDSICYCYICRSNSTTTRHDISHQKKMLDDYLFVYNYMQTIIRDNACNLSSKAIERCNARSETYLFFALVRLMKYPEIKVVKTYVEYMIKQKLYPVKKPYNGIVFSVTSTIVNHKWMLYTFNRIYNAIPLFLFR